MANMKKSVFFIPFIAAFAVLAITFASAGEVAFPDSIEVEFNEINLASYSGVVGVVGETVSVRVTFKAMDTDSDVKVKARIEGHRDDISDSTSRFDVVSGGVYSKLLTLKLPSDADDLTEEYTLYVEIVSATDKTEESFHITVQRESYTLEILSVDYDSKVAAGDVVPVTVVTKNNGFNRADDNYVIVSIPELETFVRGYMGDLVSVESFASGGMTDLTKTIYHGDLDQDGQVDEEDRTMLVNYFFNQEELSSEQRRIADHDKDGDVTVADLIYIANVLDEGESPVVYKEGGTITHRDFDDDEEDSVEKTVFLNVPNTAKAGVYELVVEVYNEDSSVITKKLISVSDSGTVTVLPTANSKDVKAGETTTFELVVVNSADSIKVFDVSAQSGSDLEVTVPAVITVGPDSSETVMIEVTADEDAEEGSYTFTVEVDGKATTFSANVEESDSSSIFALTIVLAIIFVVLLAVLIVLLTRKENTVEEAETSYY